MLTVAMFVYADPHDVAFGLCSHSGQEVPRVGIQVCQEPGRIFQRVRTSSLLRSAQIISPFGFL